MSVDLFRVVWLSAVGFFIFWQVAWGLRALRSGVATYYFNYEFIREQKPFQFWMLVVSRIVGTLVGIGMFAFGLQFFTELPK